jgi:hypothetical protein
MLITIIKNLSLTRPISLTVLINKIIQTQPQVIKLTLARTTGILGFTHAGVLNANGKIKSVKNLEQFAWSLGHSDNQSPPRWIVARLEPNEIKTAPYNSGGWSGMYISGEYRGNYGGPGSVPSSLDAEIEIQS